MNDVQIHILLLMVITLKSYKKFNVINSSVSVLDVLCVCVRRLRSDRIRIHEQLAVSIIAVQVFFLIGVGRTAADDDSEMVG